MSNSITRDFKFFSLLKFALPSIIMMVFTSLYSMVDGMFVSRFVGTNALSAVNIVYPISNVILAVGIMLATGGSAVIAKKLGEGKGREAKENFSLITLTGIIIGFVITLIGVVSLRPMLSILGATQATYDYCYNYAMTLLFFAPFTILQLLFQYFFVTAGKPMIGLFASIAGGLANIILDYIFIVPLEMGVVGAALATGIGMAIPAVFGLVYFVIKRKGSVSIVRPKLDAGVLLQTCGNGSSEMVSNVALAVVTFLYNIIMLKLLGEDGIAAITVMLYAQFMLNAVFLGFSMGVAPVFSYNYGSENTKRLKKLFKYSIIFTVSMSVVATGTAIITASPIITIFAPMGSNVYNIAIAGYGLFSLNYIFAGLNIFASSLFTALSNGRVSAIISFMRTFVFIIAGLVTLPFLWGIEGVWLALPVSEFLTLVMCGFFVFKYKKVYHYM